MHTKRFVLLNCRSPCSSSRTGPQCLSCAFGVSWCVPCRGRIRGRAAGEVEAVRNALGHESLCESVHRLTHVLRRSPCQKGVRTSRKARTRKQVRRLLGSLVVSCVKALPEQTTRGHLSRNAEIRGTPLTSIANACPLTTHRHVLTPGQMKSVYIRNHAALCSGTPAVPCHGK